MLYCSFLPQPGNMPFDVVWWLWDFLQPSAPATALILLLVVVDEVRLWSAAFNFWICNDLPILRVSPLSALGRIHI